ncbi:Conserved alpha-helical protein [Phaffia rhodozyma]|uniref:Conserved alpha-helical protein n=1 Tax=Phaffia rhodozyma TaxID=264483 RepID=A0A0F7SQX1_PHARH|nr:Conserved alpha-helical protein [Phaffia rhodozyma]
MSSSADYANVAGGSLKFKGGASSKKKKKSKSSSVSKPKEEIVGSGEGPSREGGSRRKTDAEKRFEEIQRERLAEKIAKTASKTHKDRVHDFNAKLESLSEHHDIPRVGPG